MPVPGNHLDCYGSGPAESLTLAFRWDEAPAPALARVFSAVSFAFERGNSGYFGPVSQSPRSINFTIWDERPNDPDRENRVRVVSPNGVRRDGDAEGYHVAAPRVVAWPLGLRRTLTLRHGAERDGYVPWSLMLSGRTLIGTIGVPARWGRLKGDCAYFVEYFWTRTPGCDQPQNRITWFGPRWGVAERGPARVIIPGAYRRHPCPQRDLAPRVYNDQWRGVELRTGRGVADRWANHPTVLWATR
jgi:hypothetical protein